MDLDSIKTKLNKLMFYRERAKEIKFNDEIKKKYDDNRLSGNTDMYSFLQTTINPTIQKKYMDIRTILNGEGDRIFEEILAQLPEIERTIEEKKKAYDTLNSGNNKPNMMQKGMKILGIPTKIDKVYQDMESMEDEIRPLESVKRDIETLKPIYEKDIPKGGKRKTRRNRKSKKSRNNQKKHTIKK